MYGIGIDICEVKRFDTYKEDDHFLKKIFTEKEIDYCKKKRTASQNYAARFAVKEAFAKALGTGFRGGIAFSEIEVLKDNLGKPEIILHGKTKLEYEKLTLSKIHVSISHEKTHAIGMVMLE